MVSRVAWPNTNPGDRPVESIGSLPFQEAVDRLLFLEAALRPRSSVILAGSRPCPATYITGGAVEVADRDRAAEEESIRSLRRKAVLLFR